MAVKQTALVLMGFTSTRGKKQTASGQALPRPEAPGPRGLAPLRVLWDTGRTKPERAASSAVCHGEAMQGRPGEDGGAQNPAAGEVGGTRRMRHTAGAQGTGWARDTTRGAVAKGGV